MLLPSRLAILVRFASCYTADIILSPENRARCLKCMEAIPPIGHRPKKLRPDSRYAAVLILLCVDTNGKTSMLYTRRSPFLSRHCRQISFPGGMRDDGDISYEDCALRETEEEIGLPRSRIEVWGSGPMIHPPHTASIMPVYGTVRDLKIKDLVLNAIEVDEAFMVSLEKLAHPDTWYHTQFKDGFSSPCFVVDCYRIWGVTGFLTNHFLNCLVPDRKKRKITYVKPFRTKKVGK